MSQITEPTTVQKQKPEIQFDSTVGSKNSQRINPFAEQNAKAEAKKAEKTQRRSKNRKTLKVVSLIFGVIILAAGITAGIIVWQQKSHTDQPSDAELLEQTEKQKEELVAENGNYAFGSNAAVELQQEINNIVASGANAAEINAFFNNKIQNTTSDREKNNLIILEIQVYIQTGAYENAVNTSTEISETALTPYQASIYYSSLYSAYMGINQPETANYYYDLFAQAIESNDYLTKES